MGHEWIHLSLKLVPDWVKEWRGGSHVSDRPPGATSVRLWYLSSLRMVLKVRHQVLKHLRPRPLLHPGKLWSGVTASLPVDNLGKNPVSKHRTFCEDGLFPKVGFVGAHFVSGHHTCLVPGRAELDLRTTPDHNEGVEEVWFDATWWESGVVCLKEDHADYVVTNMTLPLQLLRVVLLVGQQGGDVEHHLDAAPMRVDWVESSEVMDGVEASLVFVKSFQSHLRNNIRT